MSSRVRVGIAGTGSYVPDRVIPNSWFEDKVDTSNEWIVQRTGIERRRYAAPEQATSDMAIAASQKALAAAGIRGDELDLIVVGTMSPDHMLPACSLLVQKTLGAKKAAAFDVNAACTGFLTSLATAEAFVASGRAKKVLAIGAESLSRFVDQTDRTSCILFGDGAGAVVLERVEIGGFIGFELGADGGGGEHLWLPGSGSRHFEDADKLVKMNGREVFKFATRVMVSSAEAILQECERSVDDIDVYVPHQANVRIIDHAARKLGVPQEKVVINVDRYGNTSSGSIPLALADAETDGRLKPGELVLMTGMGAGLTWGSALIEWTMNGVGSTKPAQIRERRAA